jgi:hypothetical protein
MRHLKFKSTSLIFTFLGLSISGCGMSGSKSPTLDPTSPVTIKGKYLDDNGSGLPDTQINFRNLRRFGYVDMTAVEHAQSVALFLKMAFPFFLIYEDLFNEDPLRVDPNLFRYKPNYFLTKVRTDSQGNFSFRVRVDQLMRDEAGGINIVLVNEKYRDNRFGKYSFVVKKQDTNLGELRLCELGGIKIEETAGSENFLVQWTAPAQTVSKYVVNFAVPEDSSLVWSAEVAGDQTSVTVPKFLFESLKTRVAIEAYYALESEKTVSCLTSPKDFSLLNPEKSLGQNAKVTADEIPFRLSSLTNRKFSDNGYLEAFSPSRLTFDLLEKKTLKAVALHNLRLGSKGEFEIEVSEDGISWSVAKKAPERRFLVETFDSPVTTRYLRLAFSSRLLDLQEISIR